MFCFMNKQTRTHIVFPESVISFKGACVLISTTWALLTAALDLLLGNFPKNLGISSELLPWE